MSILDHKIDRSSDTHAILEEDSRRKKAKKITRVINEYTDIKNARVLDIGTGSGHIAHEISKSAREVASVDVADERRIEDGYEFKLTADESLPYKDNSFDVVISNHVIEHVADQQKHIDEISRVIKKGGIVYLATPNKYWLNDPHYKLPFISWLPEKAANKYLYMVSKKEWDIKPLSKLGIHKTTKNNFEMKDATIDIIKNPQQFNLDTFKQIQPVVKSTPRFVLRAVSFWTPTLIIILKKK